MIACFLCTSAGLKSQTAQNNYTSAADKTRNISIKQFWNAYLRFCQLAKSRMLSRGCSQKYAISRLRSESSVPSFFPMPLASQHFNLPGHWHLQHFQVNKRQRRVWAFRLRRAGSGCSRLAGINLWTPQMPLVCTTFRCLHIPQSRMNSV